MYWTSSQSSISNPGGFGGLSHDGHQTHTGFKDVISSFLSSFLEMVTHFLVTTTVTSPLAPNCFDRSSFFITICYNNNMNPEEKDVIIPKPNSSSPESVFVKSSTTTNPSVSTTDQQETKLETHDSIKSLRTYQGDVQEAISNNKASTTSIYLAEQGKRDKTAITQPRTFFIQTEDKNKFFAVVGVLLLILGGLAVGTGYYLSSKEKIEIAEKNKTLLSFSEEKVLELEKTDRKSLISLVSDQKKNFAGSLNSILYINLEKALGAQADTVYFLELLAPRMPPSLQRTFLPEYMFGIYSFDTNEPFIILKTEDYAGSFAGMLRWEKDIPLDLGEFFVFEKNASTTEVVFYDKEFKNRDLRIMKDSFGKTQFLYSFIDKNTLLITKNENIFSAILTKYLSVKDSR